MGGEIVSTGVLFGGDFSVGQGKMPGALTTGLYLDYHFPIVDDDGSNGFKLCDNTKGITLGTSIKTDILHPYFAQGGLSVSWADPCLMTSRLGVGLDMLNRSEDGFDPTLGFSVFSSSGFVL